MGGTNAVSLCGCLPGSPCGTRMVLAQATQAMHGGWMDGWMDGCKHTVHGPLVQARVAAAIRAVPANCARILAHMVMNRGGGGGGMQNRTGVNAESRAAGMDCKGGQARHGMTRPL